MADICNLQKILEITFFVNEFSIVMIGLLKSFCKMKPRVFIFSRNFTKVRQYRIANKKTGNKEKSKLE